MSIFFLGPPCAGKSTIAKALSEHYNDHLIQSGDIARKLGNQYSEVRRMLDEGRMAPERLMNDAMIEAITTLYYKDIIVDGYPRYWEQLADLLRLLPNDIEGHTFIHVFAPYPTLAERNKRRNRDDQDVYHQRMRLYEDLTLPVIHWFQRHNLCLDISNHIDDILSIENCITEILDHIEG